MKRKRPDLSLLDTTQCIADKRKELEDGYATTMMLIQCGPIKQNPEKYNPFGPSLSHITSQKYLTIRKAYNAYKALNIEECSELVPWYIYVQSLMDTFVNSQNPEQQHI